MHATRRLVSATLAAVLCLLLPGCGRPGFVSDKTLKDRFTRDRAEIEELVRLFESQPEKMIETGRFDPGPPKPPADATTWKKVHGLLIKLDAPSISRDSGGISVCVRDAYGFTYWFDYRTTQPSGLVQSLQEITQPGKPRGIYSMPLEGNWYARVFEDK